jgi:PEP-CTERM motif
MKQQHLVVAAGVALLAGAGVASAVPTVNGTVDVDYGAPKLVQSNSTGFGDNSDPSTGFANGSELDAGYGVVSNGRLYLFFSGNLETNFNKLDVFIASGAPGGVNQVAPLPVNQGNYNNMAGMTFDTGFDATNWISMTAGGATPDIFVDSANLVTGVGNYSGQTTPTNGALAGGNGGAVIEATFNNSNIAGVTNSTAPNDAATVPTGMEFSISLADLGWTSGDILVMAFINNGDHNYASNQFLGGLPFGTGNLGGDGQGNFTGTLSGVNLNNFAGNQFFAVAVPEPASLGLIGMGMLAATMRRQRRSA